MAAEPNVTGQALVVQGTVRVESTNGVSRAIQPNSEIFLDDRIDTGADGAVSIVLSDGDAGQLELGRMSTMVVDEDVMNTSLPELGDVAVEAGLVADLLQNWESFEPLAPLETIAPEESMDSDADEMSAAESIPGLDGSTATVADSSGVGDDSITTMDDDLDLANRSRPRRTPPDRFLISEGNGPGYGIKK